jgi:hypothetical protein
MEGWDCIRSGTIPSSPSSIFSSHPVHPVILSIPRSVDRSYPYVKEQKLGPVWVIGGFLKSVQTSATCCKEVQTTYLDLGRQHWNADRIRNEGVKVQECSWTADVENPEAAAHPLHFLSD